MFLRQQDKQILNVQYIARTYIPKVSSNFTILNQ